MSAFGGPNIIDDGLVLYLDAGNRKSYPGSGTTWFDKSGRGNNGTLINGPTFNTGSLGSVVFDGVDDYVYTPNLNLSSSFTVNIWCKFESLNTDRVLIGDYNYPDSQRRWAIFYEIFGSKITMRTSNNGLTTSDLEFNFNISNIWVNITGIYNNGTGSFYLNGDSQTTTGEVTSTLYNSNNFTTIGASGKVGGTTVSFMQGSISNIQIYNRVLSAAEVLQNYNATKGRFNL
jgi:hypothetical protein